MDELDQNELGFVLGIKKQIYNNEIRKRRETLGMSQKQLAKAVGISSMLLCSFETFKKYPKLRKKTFGGFKRDHILLAGQKLADYFGVSFHTLFPKWLSAFELKRSTIKTEQIITERMIEHKEVLLLEAPNNIEEEIDKSILKKEIHEILDTLSDREKRVIDLRFGLAKEEPWSLEKTGEVFGVSKERIRQIEAIALRKLRHPSRSKKLIKFL